LQKTVKRQNVQFNGLTSWTKCPTLGLHFGELCNMTAAEIDWQLVREAARMEGASPAAISKWRQRKKIPHRWRWCIVQNSGGLIRWDQFEDMDRAGNAS
jgi:hypothetical protein